MGWLYGWPSREDLIRHLTTSSSWKTDNGLTRETKTLHKTLRGNTLWSVRSVTLSEDPEHPRLILCCDLLSTGGSKTDRWGNAPQWGYKDMDETVGPCEVTCPLKYLELVPCPEHGYARDWRERVKQHHERRRERQRLRRERQRCP